MSSERTEQVVVRITPDMQARLEAHAAANERNLSQTIRLAIARFLDPPTEPPT